MEFAEAEKIARSFADHIESHFHEIADILLEYESFEVVQDETARTLDLLRSLAENQEYFQLRVGAVAAFLPKNQPLYALACFVVVPSLMASEVHFRIPHAMKRFYPKLLKLLDIDVFFPNIVVSHKERLSFLRERSALRVDPESDESYPVTDAVIFTGQPHHAERMRKIFDRRTLFLTNGAGHNPLVVSKDADVANAVNAVLTLQLYNQGQDCAAPNAILVHGKIFEAFLLLLREELARVRVGSYRDRLCRVGPISEPSDLVRIQELFVAHRHWLDPSTPGIIRTSEAIVEPTIICKPLEAGGNFSEVFAPVVFAQQYDKDADLAKYFESPQYPRHAMYVTLYGTSKYVSSLIGRKVNGKVLHEHSSFLHDTHLHAPGVERGTQPYGGNGDGASSLSIHGNIIRKATLPQRDIFEWIAKPLLDEQHRQEHRELLTRATKFDDKDVARLMGMKGTSDETSDGDTLKGPVYIDSHSLEGDGRRYIHVDLDQMFQLLDAPNTEEIASLVPDMRRQVKALRASLRRHQHPAVDDLNERLYAIPKKERAGKRENRERQLRFFRTLYRLLLGKESGPRLAHFLLDADRRKVTELLDV